MHLFEPLFTDKTAAEDFDAGQRLSFSYYIVTEQHQGNMAVTSDVELGSTIHIQLDYKKKNNNAYSEVQASKVDEKA